MKFAVIGQGDVDGGRAHLALRNTFRILLPQFNAPATGSPGTAPKPTQRAPLPKPVHHEDDQVRDRKQAVRREAEKKKRQWLLPWQHPSAPTPNAPPKLTPQQ